MLAHSKRSSLASAIENFHFSLRFRQILNKRFYKAWNRDHLPNRWLEYNPVDGARQTDVEEDYKSRRLGERPTDDSRELIDAAVRGAAALFRRGHLYKKAGVMLDDIQPNSLRQASLFARAAESSGISKTIDAINARMGSDTLRFAAMDIGGNWRMNQQYRSPKYSTSWKELPIAL